MVENPLFGIAMVAFSMVPLAAARLLAPKLADRRVPGRFLVRMPPAFGGLAFILLAVPFLLGFAAVGLTVAEGLGFTEGDFAYDLFGGAGAGLGIGIAVGLLMLPFERYEEEDWLHRPAKKAKPVPPGQEPRASDLAALLASIFFSLALLTTASLSKPLVPWYAGVFTIAFVLSTLTLLVFVDWNDEAGKLRLRRKVPPALLAFDAAALVIALALVLSEEPSFFLHLGWEGPAIIVGLAIVTAVQHVMHLRRQREDADADVA